MGDVRVPAWHSATGLHADNDRVYDAFGELLHNLPMSYTELAARIGVSQPAVSRWASLASHPSLDEMSAAYAAVADHLDGIREYLDRFGRVLVLIEEAVRLRAVEGARPSQPDSSPRELRRLELANRLWAALGQDSESAPSPATERCGGG